MHSYMYKLVPSNLILCAQIRSGIKAAHIKKKLKKLRTTRSNHKSTVTLLDVPTHSDLLGDQNDDDESERGRQLVRSQDGWRVEMARWIGKVRDAEASERLEERDAELQSINRRRTIKWKPITLENLFGGTKHKPARPSRTIEEEEEEALAQAMAEAAEDEVPDDGAIEIGSDEEYQ
jgi:hypothetical protein